MVAAPEKEQKEWKCGCQRAWMQGKLDERNKIQQRLKVLDIEIENGREAIEGYDKLCRQYLKRDSLCEGGIKFESPKNGDEL